MPALFVQGAGARLWDNRGNEYLDFLAGIAVCSLGHCHPVVVAAITRQAQQLIHASNILLTAPQAKLAAKLCELSGMDRAFFAVCGATANEAALKIAKKHGNQLGGKHRILCLDKGFHGRTMGALSATGTEKYREPFMPLVPGFEHLPIDDLAALENAFSDDVAAVLIEPIMGEGGVYDISHEYLQRARQLCDENQALLIFDEVQSGIGRTGDWFAFQHAGVRPDVLVLAKGLGGGVPIGAVLARGTAAETLVPGDHGSTFGGNPLACSAALAVIETIEQNQLLAHVRRIGDVFRTSLEKFECVAEVHGRGLMIGAKLALPNARDVVGACFDKGLILNATDDQTLRFVPPLILTLDEARHGLTILADVLGEARPEFSLPVPSAKQTSTYHDLLSIDDLNATQLEELLSLAAFEKQRRRIAPAVINRVEGRTVAMVFEKPSLRTRVSFESAVSELGGHPVYLSKADIGMGSRESVKDVASNLSQWCSMIIARLYWHRQLVELADISDVPVVNALTEWEHPCQSLADMMTIRESFGLERVKIAYVGDGNNVARSLAKLAVRLGYEFTLVGPKNFQLESIDGITQTEDLRSGLRGASVIYTDVWISMGDEHEQEHRVKVFSDYQVNDSVMAMAEKNAIFLHCLPARRGFEVTDSVIDGEQSRVTAQADNRFHAQKALLAKILGLA
jgi:ornithine carbamoyltransferase